MTTNELECPVCDSGVFGEVEELYHCSDCGWVIHKEIMHKIQLRIDKEKAAAVQEERERVVAWIEERKQVCDEVMRKAAADPDDLFSALIAQSYKAALNKLIAELFEKNAT